MHRNIDQWHSPSLNKNMEIVSYGHYGFALLLLPTAAADFLEYERFLMIDVLAKYINGGKLKVFSINSINNESWLNSNMEGRHKAIRHTQFNNYVYNEVIPYIKNSTSPDTPVITSGASFGALHAANLFFKNPWLINGCIAMSGIYDLGAYTKSYWDEDTYFNSPMHYLNDMQDENHLNGIRSSQHIHILSGSGDYEDPNASRYLSGLLHHKHIPHHLDIWGYDIKHDWPTWRAMLPYLIESKF
ncbi:MAG TPA: alpha/beta hydrolase-fold protein [Saprospiraceae bacterium]|nr:alpha/beta hydrolase-fold protein [Saprospiraceae bacterium]